MLKKSFISLILLLSLLLASASTFSQTKRRHPAVPGRPKTVQAAAPPVQLTPEQEKRLEAFKISKKNTSPGYYRL